ncbi:Sel1 repeat family protein [Gammaproteobacteria bacterium]
MMPSTIIYGNKSMRSITRAGLVAFVLLMGFSRLGIAGPFEQGVVAFQQGNYMTAFRFWNHLAKQGDALSQYNLGVMFYEGYGVPQDYADAAKWFRKAAAQGNSDAQRNLGVMYYEGNGVPKDNVRAHMWFNLSAINGNNNGAKDRNVVAKRMTFTQIAEAQRLAREWTPTQELQGRH